MTKWIAFLVLLTVFPRRPPANDIAPLLSKIKAVGKEGYGNVEAIQAWKELTKHGPEVLIDILTALDDANPVAANWLRSAVESIADRTLKAGKSLSAEKLEKFVKDTQRSGAARYLAYEWLARIDSTANERLLSVSDPGAELRREAIAGWVDRLDRGLRRDRLKIGTQEFIGVYRGLFAHARDRDQVLHLAKQLKTLDVDVDLTAHFNFITRWQIVGPFDNTSGKGFYTSFPPDKAVDPAAEYEGKDLKKLRWSAHETKDTFGIVDLNKAIGHLKAATAFAYTVVDSPKERPVDIRAGSNNAVRIYLNGKEIFFRDEYHHGMKMDQYIGKGKLKAGRNEILIKVCQNEQTEAWAQLWSFQLRVCDDIGGAVPVIVVTDRKSPEKQP